MMVIVVIVTYLFIALLGMLHQVEEAGDTLDHLHPD